jgi:methionyl-tRNA formyltransferase
VKFVYLANGRVGLELLQWLVSTGSPPTGLVVHPPEKARDRAALVDSSGLSAKDVFDASRVNSEEGTEWLTAQAPEWLISVFFGYVLRPPALAVPARGTLNLHPAFLPYNRGAYPNVWPIVDKTPAGVTLHYVDESIDTGDIAAQHEVPVYVTDTGATLYARLEEASIALFKECWPRVQAGTLPRVPQAGRGTFHRVADVGRVDRIVPDAMYRAADLIDLLRARTFAPHQGAYLDLGDRRVYLRLELVAMDPEDTKIRGDI